MAEEVGERRLDGNSSNMASGPSHNQLYVTKSNERKTAKKTKKERKKGGRKEGRKEERKKKARRKERMKKIRC